MSDRPALSPEISVVLTAHREGLLAAPTVRSAQAAITFVGRQLELACELVVVLDRADALTREVLSEACGEEARLLEIDQGDPGQARNAGIEVARGSYAAFLDGDDLWSFNWLAAAWTMSRARPDAILHSTCNIVFGEERNLWWHVDSEAPEFDPDYLPWANYWDALSFAPIQTYRTHPFHRNDLAFGYGHEDWHWNCSTLAAGLAHKPVPETIHFKRRRKRSQMSRVSEAGAVMRPLELG